MVFRLARRAVWGGLTFFALLGFASVPLGTKTGWEHLKAIVTSPEGRLATSELTATLGSVRLRFEERARSWFARQASDQILPRASANPPSLPTAGHNHREYGAHELPTPRPPHLSP